jgi:hypothetical protein
MNIGDSVLINYKKSGLQLVGTYYGTENGNNLFRDRKGYFAVSEKAIKEGRIVLEVLEDID